MSEEQSNTTELFVAWVNASSFAFSWMTGTDRVIVGHLALRDGHWASPPDVEDAIDWLSAVLNQPTDDVEKSLVWLAHRNVLTWSENFGGTVTIDLTAAFLDEVKAVTN